MTSNPASPRPFQPAPEIQAWLDELNRTGNDLDRLAVEHLGTIRQVREERARQVLSEIALERVCTITVPGEDRAWVPVRMYVPLDKQLARAGKLPVVLFFHGGGWMLGSPSSYDSVTRELARSIPALVLSVDYRLAPENPFPAAVYDADATLGWVSRHAQELGGDPARIVVAGDSAGGTLAIASVMRARGANASPVAMQVLFYPSTNISSTDYESYRQYGEGHLLTHRAVEKFREFYLPEQADWTRPETSPLLAEDLSGMPPTLLIGAGCDPLRDEGEAYARKLRQHGTPVTYRLEPQLLHAFLNHYNIEPACSPYAGAVLGYAAGVIRKRCTEL
ncbi:MAG TPA: alpha/beta hydrolase [Clostridia bacterium]|nr:alpha/beta hydrolase [Clostridia bacterium]